MKAFQCPYCGVGCGLLWDEGKIRGDKSHPASRGEVCKKPLYYPEAMHKGRAKRDGMPERIIPASAIFLPSTDW